ncbi:MAG: hypothetical protein Q4G61_05525 [Tissierellia bacterium]|nr:hypothetical protein [Tissierellia bacterium]
MRQTRLERWVRKVVTKENILRFLRKRWKLLILLVFLGHDGFRLAFPQQIGDFFNTDQVIKVDAFRGNMHPVKVVTLSDEETKQLLQTLDQDYVSFLAQNLFHQLKPLPRFFHGYGHVYIFYLEGGDQVRVDIGGYIRIARFGSREGVYHIRSTLLQDPPHKWMEQLPQ